MAEDYAVVAAGAISAVQVKENQHLARSRSNTESVRDAISSFVTLTALNHANSVSPILHDIGDRNGESAAGSPGRCSRPGCTGEALQKVPTQRRFAQLTQIAKNLPNLCKFVRSRGDYELRRDLLRKIHWDCGKPDLASLRKEFQDRLVVVGRDTFGIPAPDALRISNLLVHHVESIELPPPTSAHARRPHLCYRSCLQVVPVLTAMLGMLANKSSGILAQMLGGADAGLPVAVNSGRPAHGSDLPPAKNGQCRAQKSKNA